MAKKKGPKSARRVITTRIPPALQTTLQVLAAMEGRPLERLHEDALLDYVALPRSRALVERGRNMAECTLLGKNVRATTEGRKCWQGRE